jgi:hypothetical protein
MNVSPVYNEADKPWLRSKCSFTLPSSLLGVVRGSTPDKTGTNGIMTDSTRLFALESRLEARDQSSNVCEFGGNDVAADGSDGILLMYGPNADRLLDVVEPILKMTNFTSGAKVTWRWDRQMPANAKPLHQSR